jgi:hypothetical protein
MLGANLDANSVRHYNAATALVSRVRFLFWKPRSVKTEMGSMIDAILFSANPSRVDIDDAITHLENHTELYWSVGFRVAKTTKETFSFPLFGFIHIRGEQVKYRALVADILPFAPEHYENVSVKPEPWRLAWGNDYNNVRSHPSKQRWL